MENCINYLHSESIQFFFYKRRNILLKIRCKMEQHLEKALNEVLAEPETVGCMFANRQGLCLGAKGKIDPNISGIAVAISEQACKLEPNLNPPTIVLHSGQKRAIIQKDGDLTGVIYKETPK